MQQTIAGWVTGSAKSPVAQQERDLTHNCEDRGSVSTGQSQNLETKTGKKMEGEVRKGETTHNFPFKIRICFKIAKANKRSKIYKFLGGEDLSRLALILCKSLRIV